MKPSRRLLQLLLLAPFLGCQAISASVNEERPLPVAAAVARVEEYVRHLASDAMAGREAGSVQALEAADYISRSFMASGLRPAGDGGTYLADIGYRGWTLTELVVQFVAPDGQVTPLEHGVDYSLMRGSPVQGSYAIDVVASADEIDALEDGGSPGALVLDASSRGLTGRALRGASYNLMAGLGKAPLPGVELVLVASYAVPGESRPLPERFGGKPGQATYLWLRGEALAAVQAGNVASVQLTLSGIDPIEAVNVIGLLPGVGTTERPELADEAIVFTAHYDHVGVLSPGVEAGENGDTVYNGADDDASGVAAVMALAQAFGNGEAPARTLVFLAVTAEEKGLLGSQQYVKRPAVPLDDTVCNLNFEMIGMPDSKAGGPGHLFLTGYERTNLGPAWAELGVPLVPDPRPRRNYFERSDNYSFARLGIVAQTLSSGGENPHYHKLSDEADTLDFDHMRTVVEACYEAARPLVEGSLDPAWEPDGRP